MFWFTNMNNIFTGQIYMPDEIIAEA